MDNEIEDIKNRLSNIENKLDKLLSILDENMVENCNKMGEHIDFVENVYKIVSINNYLRSESKDNKSPPIILVFLRK